MPQPSPTWVRKYACPTDLSGGQCIGDDEILTHHTPRRGQYVNAPRVDIEVEVSMIRGRVDKAEACRRRNGGAPAHPVDVAAAGVRHTTAGTLRAAGFAVVHTCGRRGEGNPHVSAVWPAANPLDEPDPKWPEPVQEAFAACFTEEEG